MFPLGHSDDLWSQMFTNLHQDQTNQQDQIMGEIAFESQDLTNNMAQTQNQNQNQNIVDTTACSDHPIANDPVNKNIVHIELERQRRKQQATLFASLRWLLPIEVI
ncbi:uncharacterized protein LOC130763942 [Actinidia eriantha]|uniref:uncharacterized protein LOC130763942 n=1 Tax=Actinidia eriantha TaxID=165200 RepID=UPI00258B7462|nr:uncharacterized protein LOC130763942 [Actinidia eriantha]